MFQKPSSDIALSNASQSHQTDDVETVVGPSVTVEGDFASEGNIVGSAKTSRLLTVETGAQILASVRCGNAVISGLIKGNVRVTDRLELSDTAQISGDISCKTLVVAAGALVHGKVSMKGIAKTGDSDEKKRPARKSREASEAK